MQGFPSWVFLETGKNCVLFMKTHMYTVGPNPFDWVTEIFALSTCVFREIFPGLDYV